MVDESQINVISKIDAISILNSKIGIGDITEMNVVENAIRLARTKMIGDRMVEFSGITRNKDFLIKAVAEFKKNVASNRPISLASKTSVNSIGIESLDRPQIFGLTTFRQTGLTANTVINVIPTGAGTFDLTIDEERIIITDLVEIDPAAGVEAITLIDDGDSNRQPESLGLDFRMDGAIRVKELDQPRIIDSSLNLDARLVEGTTLEIIPVGIHMFIGTSQDAL